MNEEHTLGSRLRELRNERNLSQKKLSELSGISQNSISLIERDAISPSVSTLTALAAALSVRIISFFEETEEYAILHVKSGERPILNSQGVAIEGLGGRLHEQEMEPYLVHLAPHTSIGENAVMHTGHEIVYCLEGRFEYLIDKQSHLLEQGDFLLFEANLPHLWRNVHDKPAAFLLILQTPGAKLDSVKRHFLDYPSIPSLS